MLLSHCCHWALSSHRLRIAGPAAIAIRRCCALYLSHRTPLPSHCIRLHRRAIVRCHRFIVLHDRHRVLVHNAWALQPGGGWLRGVALAPPDCGGGCALWWALVVAARAVGHWATGTVLLCATPGPLGLVDGGHGGCWWCPPIAVAVARHRGRWWVVVHEHWEWGNRHRALARNAWVFRPGGQRRGMGATGGPRLLSSSWRPVVVAVGGSQPGHSTSSVSRASAQCQGLSTR